MRSAWVMFLLAGLCCSVCAHAQNGRGTILGTVTDSTGAVVSQAKVRVTNADTGIVTSIATNNEGLYLAPNLIPGHYSVTVEQPGFRKFAASDLVLLVDQKLRVDGHLAPGDVNAEVIVTSTTQMVNTDSSTLGHVVENKQITDLPLVNRNFQNLAALSPATVVVTGNKVFSEQADRNPLKTAIYVGGSRATSAEYMLDGVDNNDPSVQNPTITPSIDAIQEFKLLNKGYSAEYGSGSAQVNLVLKSGTNDLHGTVYEFLRNDVLNATDYFAVPDLTGRRKPQLRYNLFGFSLGGPVVIPHVVNGHKKLFFFTNYEGNRIRAYSLQEALFPTAAELSGDFSADPVIYDPQTGAPFPGNIIPSNRISQKSQQVIGFGLFGVPTLAQPVGGFNAIGLLGKPTDANQFSVRGDAKLSERDALFSRYSWSKLDDFIPSLSPFSPLTSNYVGYNIGVGEIHTFGPTLINELRLGYNRPNITRLQAGGFGKDIAGSLFQGTDRKPADFGAPAFGFSQYTGVGSQDGPLAWITNSYSIADTLTWVAGKHTLKFGTDLRHVRYYESYVLEGRGVVVFNGSFTAGAANPIGNSVADFLLGLPLAAAVTQGVNSIHMRANQYHGFIQDDWKVFPRLTLNLGLRYEYRAPFHEDRNRIKIFDADYPGGRVVTPDAALVAQLNSPLVGYTPFKGLVHPDWNNFGPRIGFAFRPFHANSTVINGGYGLVYDQWEANENIFDVFGPPQQRSFFQFGSAAQPIDYNNLFPSAALPAAGTGLAFSLDPHNRTPYSQEWNLTVEHELKSNWLVQLGYQGAASTRLSVRNVITQGILQPNGTVVPSPWYNWAAVIQTSTTANANYHAGTAMIEKRFSGGYYFQAHYTYAKLLGTNSQTCGGGTDGCIARQNYWDPKAEYGPAAYDLTHRFVLNGIWELPVGRGKMWAGGVHGIADKFISGWQVGGLYQKQSGFPFSVGAQDASGTGAFLARADLVGDPFDKRQDPLAGNKLLAFNRTAFAQPKPGTFGNSRRNMLRGPGMNSVDLSIIKNIGITERLKLQFRTEMFNALNHPQFGPAPANLLFNPDPNSNFGLYHSLQVDPRIIQLAMKVIF